MIKNLKIKIETFTEASFPGWVLCSFQDIEHNIQYFEEKVPIVTTDLLDENSLYPQESNIACDVLKEEGNIITIDLMSPYSIQTENGKSIFQVFSNQISN